MTTSPIILPNNDYVPGAHEFILEAASQKAGWGSNAINGATMGDIIGLTITRYDDTTRFPGGSGPAVAPYLNIWVTDGNGNYAVLANEPSNPAFQPLFTLNGNGSRTYHLDFEDLKNHPVQVYETPNGGYGSTTTWVHDMFGNAPLLFKDIEDLVIAAPDAAYIADPLNAVGGGAPRELGTNMAYGVNWIFGDTAGNYVSGIDGYIVGLAGVSQIPEPTSVALWGVVGATAIAWAYRRRRRAKA